MTEYKIEITETAIKDLNDIYFYISSILKNVKSAKLTIKGILNKINSLKIFPERYKLINIPKKELRSVRYKKYLIIYNIKPKEKIVIIDRIIYGKRDLNKILNG